MAWGLGPCRKVVFLLPFLCLQGTADSFIPTSPSPSSYTWGPWSNGEPIHPLMPSGEELGYSISSGGCNQTCLSWQVPVLGMALGCHPLTSSWMYSSYRPPHIPVPLQRDPHAAPGLQSSAGRRRARWGETALCCRESPAHWWPAQVCYGALRSAKPTGKKATGHTTALPRPDLSPKTASHLRASVLASAEMEGTS